MNTRNERQNMKKGELSFALTWRNGRNRPHFSFQYNNLNIQWYNNKQQEKWILIMSPRIAPLYNARNYAIKHPNKGEILWTQGIWWWKTTFAFSLR